jgi:hypothetical protein
MAMSGCLIALGVNAVLPQIGPDPDGGADAAAEHVEEAGDGMGDVDGAMCEATMQQRSYIYCCIRICDANRPTVWSGELEVAKKAAKKKIVRKEYTAADIKLLKAHSKAKTPVSKLVKLMKRTEGSLRQKARMLGLSLGHQR